jgi:GNAT superfamily N-acetyltransferase
MVWRVRVGGKAAKRAVMEARVLGGKPVEILAYADGEPVAWCFVLPRETYRKLGGEEYLERTNVWTVVCFLAQRKRRGRGITHLLLEGEVEADVMEARSVDPESPSYDFMGRVPAFVVAGLEEVVGWGRVGTWFGSALVGS